MIAVPLIMEAKRHAHGRPRSIADLYGGDAPGFPARRRLGSGLVGTLADGPERPGGGRVADRAVGDPAAPGRRSQPARDVRPQTRRPRRDPGAVRLDRDAAARRAGLRAPASTGGADGPRGAGPIR